MKVIKFEPFDKIDRYFEDFPLSFPRWFGWGMAVDVFEQNRNVIAKMNLPGIDPDKIEVTVEGNTLQISGEREEEKEEKDKEYYCKEIRQGTFSRVVELPHSVDDSKTEASYKDGVLTVVMPTTKEEEKSTKKIKVKKV